MSATLEASLRLEIAQYQTSLAKAQGDAVKFKERLKKEGDGVGSALFGKMKGELAGLLPAIGIAAAVGGFKSLTNSMDDLVDTALRLNESTETIQKVEYASKLLASVDADGLTKYFLKLERAMADVENPAANEALQNLGLTADKLIAMPLDQKILALSDAFQTARASGTGFRDISELIGKSAGGLIPMLMQTRETIEGLFSQAHIVPDSEVQRLADLNDKIDGFFMNVKSWAAEFTGASIDVGGGLASIIGDLWNGKSLDDAFSNTADAYQKAADASDARQKEREEKRKQASIATAKAREEAKVKEAEKAGKATKAAQKKLDEAKEKAAYDNLDLNEKIQKKSDEVAAPNTADANNPVAVLEVELKRVEAQVELKKLMEEQASLIRQAAEDTRRNAKDEKDRLETKRKQTEEVRKQSAQRNSSRESGARDLEVLRLRARGNDKRADQLEREAGIAEDAAKEMKDHGYTKDQALKIARERAELQDKIDNRNSGRGSHIYGVRGEGRKMGSAGGGGINEFDLLNKETTDKNGIRMKLYSNPLDGRGTSTIPGRLMGGIQGSLADRAAIAAGNQDARGAGDSSGMSMASKILDVLIKGLIGG